MSMDADQEQRDGERDRALINRALGGNLTSAYQPIIDLDRGVVLGYEALARYQPGITSASPRLFTATDLFESARRIGRTDEIEAAAITAALQVRNQLPRDCLLFIKVGLASLIDERVDRVLRDQGDLCGVVLELDDPGHRHLEAARASIERFRDRGSLIAVVDPFLDPTRLDTMMAVGSGFFKLDRQLIAGVSANNTKLAVVDSVRHLADRLGVGLIAQGIEDLSDLRSLERLGIAFGQGYFLARPSTERRFAVSLNGRNTVNEQASTAGAMLGRLVEAVCELTEHELDQPLTMSSGIEFEVLVSEVREPLALMRRVGRRIESLSLTLVDDRASVQHAARVAMRRPQSTRFEPLVCVDQFGACTGVVRVERLLAALAGEDRTAAHAGMNGAGTNGAGPNGAGSNGAVTNGAGTSPAGTNADGHRNRHAFDFSCRPSRQRRNR